MYIGDASSSFKARGPHSVFGLENKWCRSCIRYNLSSLVHESQSRALTLRDFMFVFRIWSLFSKIFRSVLIVWDLPYNFTVCLWKLTSVFSCGQVCVPILNPVLKSDTRSFPRGWKLLVAASQAIAAVLKESFLFYLEEGWAITRRLYVCVLSCAQTLFMYCLLC